MKKKLFSLVMAVAMIASLAIPALASDNTQTVTGKGSQSAPVSLAGAMALPAVNVTMPKSGNTILNPYKMQVKNTATINNNDVETDATNFITDQVLSARQVITNKTAAPLNVGIAITATPSDGVVMATAPCTGKETTKSVFMFAEAQYSAANATAPTTTSLTWTEPGKVNAKCYPQIVAGTSEASNANFFVLPAASDTTPNYLVWTLSGNTATAPDGGWASTDKVTTAVTFTFTPTVLVDIEEDADTTANVATLAIGSALGTNDTDGLTAALTSSNKLQVAQGTIVRVVAEDGATISTVEVKDSVTSAKVTATKVNAGLYYFVTPPNGATVKITGTAAS